MKRKSLLAYFSVLSLATGNNAQQVYYIGFSSPATENLQNKIANSTIVLTDLMARDDSPFHELLLPFSFVVYGTVTDRMFASANGGLHFSYEQPYEAGTFAVGTVDGFQPFNESYYGLVAGFVSDLDPSKSKGNITYTSSPTFFELAFNDIAYYGTQYGSTFRIFVANDSHIELKYDRINRGPGGTLPDKNLWISGLRSLKRDAYTYYSAQQVRTGRSDEWSTVVPGVYPLYRADVVDGTQFNLCPVSMTWCMTPSNISVPAGSNNNSNSGGLSNVTHTVTLTTLMLSCEESLVDYGVMVVSDTAGDQTGGSSGGDSGYLTVAGCTRITNNNSSSSGGGGGGITLPTLACTFSFNETVVQTLQQQAQNATASTTAADEVTLHVVPAWRPKESVSGAQEHSYTALPVEPLTLTIRFATNDNSSSSSHSVGGVNSTNSCSSSNTNSSCSGCSICNGDLSCLSLPCAPNDSAPTAISELFARPSCNGTCPSGDQGQSPYYTDDTNACCALADMDCSGTCHGSDRVALNTDRAEYCCPAASTVDCHGVCGGAAVVDGCGMCGGGDVNGVTCFDPTLVTVRGSFKDDPAAPGTTTLVRGGVTSIYPVYDISSGGSGGGGEEGDLTQRLRLFVHNGSPKDILIKFSGSSDGASAVAPVITLPAAATILLPASTGETFNVTMSLSGLYHGDQTVFAAKSIRMSYSRADYPPQAYHYNMTVLVSTAGCEALNSIRSEGGGSATAVGLSSYSADIASGACVRMPGCMYCLANPNTRILRGVTGEENDWTDDGSYDNSDSDQSTGNWTRRLFTYLVPKMVVNSDHRLRNGFCMDGWSADMCASAHGQALNRRYSSAGERSAIMFYNSWTFGGYICVLTLLHLFVM